jgi:hypothetical protein
MTPLEQEIDNNRQAFLAGWTAQAQKNWAALGGNAQFVQSYKRLSTLNALQNTLIAPAFTSGSAAFFLEAQNDALVSHVNAHVGSWRTALQSLRGCIENSLSAIYFSEHPVELELWSKGQFRIGFQELHKYLSKHPRLTGIDANTSGLNDLKTEYETLSKAVHASAANFRMTDGASKVLLWSTDSAKLGSWATREKKVIEAICALMVCLLPAELRGAKNQQLRAMVSFVTRPARRTTFRAKLGVNIAAP